MTSRKETGVGIDAGEPLGMMAQRVQSSYLMTTAYVIVGDSRKVKVLNSYSRQWEGDQKQDKDAPITIYSQHCLPF